MIKTKDHVWIYTLAGASLLTVIICPFLGMKILFPKTLLLNEQSRYIFFTIRVPRTFAAFFAGGGLAMAGLVYQALFRNLLASPYTLGVSSGASLGAALCISTGIGGSILGMSFVSMAAFTGAVSSVFIIYSLAWIRDSNSNTFLLAGVVVATVCSSLLMFVHYISPLRRSFQIMRWIMGGLDGISLELMLIMAIPLFFFLCVIVFLLPQLDQFLTGEEIAHSHGINVSVSRNIFIVVTALAVGAIVAVCGPIGFVGIIAPHTSRLLFPSARHRRLAWSSFTLGGSFLVLSDTFARTLAPPAEIPVGIITALFGGPFFLYVLFRRRHRFYI